METFVAGWRKIEIPLGEADSRRNEGVEAEIVHCRGFGGWRKLDRD
jgi:hypothetical protein